MAYTCDLEKEDTYYCYPGTNILKNKLNIKDEEALNDAEREIVALKFTDLYQNPIKGNLDFKQYKDIHKRLFEDLYDFAGETRNCDIFKHNYFCLSQHIKSSSEYIFQTLKKKNYFINLDYEDKINELANLYSDLNALHPFREGNGRVVREFIEELAKINGIDLDLSNVNKNKLLTASVESFIGKYNNLLEIFHKKSSPISSERQLQSIDNYCSERLANYLKNNLEIKNTRSK